MRGLLAGTKIGAAGEFGGGNAFCEFFAIVRKGHEECGDSAFVYCDDRKLAAGVFDGVSGEEGAASASSEAASAALKYLAKAGKADENTMKEAMAKANGAIRSGYTTAALLFMKKDGSFIVAGVGDSPIYSVNAKGGVDVELPIGRPVGDAHSILKYLALRNLVTAVLGNQEGGLSMHVRGGTLAPGEMLVIASDGLSDNLYFKVDGGYVSDTSGSADLAKLIGKKRKPKSIISSLIATISARISKGRIEEKTRFLVPKEDDIAIVAIQFGSK